ncbi:hypothetical protein BKA66DRAFT_430409 [Pyrenochaeta sp. MPI-SDFR-AT-0127]|nr:hypothetical protein BKA66DRAFT_430409 [Pyrenochaeta sp. MPI-SDFR-AT-0127]
MSDVEQNTPNKTGASGATWSDAEKIAYLIVLCENEGKVESKIAHAPIPAGRSIISCKKLLWRLKEKHKTDIQKIKAGQPIATAVEGEATTSPEKLKTPRKRKAKVQNEGEASGDTDGSPMKKTGTGKKKCDTFEEDEVKEQVKEENFEE